MEATGGDAPGDAKSGTRTLRLEPRVDEFLRRTADREGVSVNFLVTKALRKLVEWDAYAEKFGVVSVPQSLVARAMDYLSDDQARELGAWYGKNLVKEFVTFWFKEASLQTLFVGFPRLASRYGKAFEYEERREGPRWLLVLKHGQGRKWSLFYEELLKGVLEDVSCKDVRIERTDDQVVVRFTLS